MAGSSRLRPDSRNRRLSAYMEPITVARYTDIGLPFGTLFRSWQPVDGVSNKTCVVLVQAFSRHLHVYSAVLKAALCKDPSPFPARAKSVAA